MRMTVAKAAKITGLIVVIPGVVAGAIWAYYYFNKELPMEKVDITVEYSPGDTCSAEKPMSVVIENHSGHKIGRSTFDIKVKREGHSIELTRWNYHYYSTDIIIPSGTSYSLCLEYPELVDDYKGKFDRKKLIYWIENKSLSFID